jgi:hypothetical protein
MASWQDGAMRRRFVYAVLALTALLTAIGPEATTGLALPAASAFWFASTTVGLGLAVLAARVLSHVPALLRGPAWRLLALAGLAGVLLYAPFALWLESVLIPPGLPQPDDDWLDGWEREGGLRAIAAEALQAGPAYLLSWALINLPSWRVETTTRSPVASADAVTGAKAAPAIAVPSLAAPWPGDDTGDSPDTDAASFLARLPPAIGRDLVAITADLHYLQVETRRGRATLLGGLAEAERALGSRGLRVHRSHWVAVDAVRRVARGAGGWHCELASGTRVPVSRRRVAEVRARFGADFVVDAPRVLR